MSETNTPETAPVSRMNPIQLIITLGLIAGFVVTYILCVGSDANLLHTILWLFAVLAPYMLIFVLCVVRKGMPKFLRNKVGGIIMLALLVVMLVLTYEIVGWLFWACVAFFCLGGAKLIGGSTSAVTITRKDSSGHTVTETRRYMGDQATAAGLAAKELESEGYKNVTIETE